MWISRNILSKMVDLNGITPEELALKITMSTAEIDSIEYMNQHLKTIKTAKILKIIQHPAADKLTIVDLTHGDDKVRVICGAPNHREGDIVCLADIGTNFGGGFIIKQSKIRGEDSNGMICSEKEMGIGEAGDGVMILPADTKLGIPISELMPEWCDIRYEIDNKSITHRPDLWSHRGFALEIGAILGREVINPINNSLEKEIPVDDLINIDIQSSELCQRYTALVVENIKIEPSPSWLKAAITSMGMRPINNIVDITNYVMSEIGEPLHAFDRNKLQGNTIFVRLASPNEELTTLDDTSHKLTDEDIVIADKSRAIALAGVMGGLNSEIENSTSAIVLEAANFNSTSIRKTSGRFNYRTDAAARFEKSLSPEITMDAVLRSYELIKLVCPQAEAVACADSYPVKQKPINISITCSEIRTKLGQDISDEKIISILTSLSFTVTNDEGALKIDVPYYRATKDVSIAADIVEEVGRIYGYDNITPIPPVFPCTPPPANVQRKFEREIKNILSRNIGMIEVSGYSFTGEEILNKLEINEDKELRLKNALSGDYDRLSSTLIPNIIKNIESNKRYYDNFKIYEVGRVHVKSDRKSFDLAEEKRRITGAFYSKKSETPIFYSAKNAVEILIEELRCVNIKTEPCIQDNPPYAHPKRSLKYTFEGKLLALVFELHPKIADKFGISGNTSIFDIDMDLLFKIPKKQQKFAELQKYPDVPFDISVVCNEKEYSSKIGDIIKKSVNQYLKSLEVVSVYKDEKLGDKKSVSFRVVLYSKEKTLEHSEIANMQQKIIENLKKQGYELR
jgi:phenylalanyl-tRNA synthetase beta chain